MVPLGISAIGDHIHIIRVMMFVISAMVDHYLKLRYGFAWYIREGARTYDSDHTWYIRDR